MKQDEGYPLYTKVAWVVSWAVMVLFLGLIFKNCAGSIRYGAETTKEQIDHYYQLGHRDGQTGKPGNDQMTDFVENPLLKKAYNKGFREGFRGRNSGGPPRVTD